MISNIWRTTLCQDASAALHSFILMLFATRFTFIKKVSCDLDIALGLVVIWKLHSDSLLFTPYAHFSFKYTNNISSVVNYAALIWGEYLHRNISCLFQETRLGY